MIKTCLVGVSVLICTSSPQHNFVPFRCQTISGDGFPYTSTSKYRRLPSSSDKDWSRLLNTGGNAISKIQQTRHKLRIVQLVCQNWEFNKALTLNNEIADAGSHTWRIRCGAWISPSITNANFFQFELYISRFLIVWKYQVRGWRYWIRSIIFSPMNLRWGMCWTEIKKTEKFPTT